KVVDRAGDFGNHHVGVQRHLHFGGDGVGGVDQVVFTQGSTHFKTGGGQEGVGDTATHNQLVTNARQRGQHVESGGHFGTGGERHHRTGRLIQRFAQCVQLGRQQRAGTGHQIGRAHV